MNSPVPGVYDAVNDEGGPGMRVSRKTLQQRIAIFHNLLDGADQGARGTLWERAAGPRGRDVVGRTRRLLAFLEIAPPPAVQDAIEVVLTLDGEIYVWDPIEIILGSYLDSLEESA